MKSLARRHLPAVLSLFTLFLIVFAPFIFRTHHLGPHRIFHWDFASQFYPWLVYTSDTLRTGIWPLWCPYVGAGTPFFLNPQNPLYSPVTWLFSLTIGYTHYTSQLQGIVLLLAGSIGAYALSYALWRSRAGGMVAALSFGLSSALFGNMQHYSYLNVYALMPWTFLAILGTARGLKGALPALVLVLYMLIVSGYPAVVFMTLAWGLAWAIFLVRQSKQPASAQRTTLFKGLAAGGVAVGLASVYWLPILAFKDEFTRGDALSLEQALHGGHLSFKHLLNLLFQFVTTYSLPGPNTDISMRGIYIGALALPLVAIAVMRRRDVWTAAMGVFSLGAFLMACGWEFFGRVALHVILPAFNFSRFPAGDSRALMVLGLALLAGRGMQVLCCDDAVAKQLGRRSLWALLIIFVGALFWFQDVYPPEVYFNGPAGYLVINLLLVIVALVVWPSINARWARRALLGLLVLDLGIGVHANIDLIGERTGDYAEIERQHRREFTAEAAAVPRELGTTGSLLELGKNEPANVGHVSKTFYLGEYNPLRTKRLNHLLESGLTEWLRGGDRVVSWPQGSLPESAPAFLSGQRPLDFAITHYGPNAVTYHVRLPKATWLVFNEIYFPGWRLKTADLDVPMVEVLGGLRGARLEAGSYEITTYFQPGVFWKALATSLSTLFLAILWGLWGTRRRRQIGQNPPGVSKLEVGAGVN